MRPVGRATRGTTGRDRLRRSETWTTAVHGSWLASVAGGTAVDLGFGASGITTAQWARRLPLAVTGLEIDPARVATARAEGHAGVAFALGGFELAGLRPVLVRAFNVLRQYDEAEVGPAWSRVLGRLATDGRFLEGTCSEDGRVASWVWLGPDGPRTLTLASSLAHLDDPATLAERLPKVLIHRNVDGERVHALLQAASAAWRRSRTPDGPRQRWLGTVRSLQQDGWPVLDRPRGTLRGELTLPWSAVQPSGWAAC